jgi:hypothetical protein
MARHVDVRAKASLTESQASITRRMSSGGPDPARKLVAISICCGDWKKAVVM